MPSLPTLHSSYYVVILRLEKRKRCCDATFSSREGTSACHLMTGGNYIGLVGGDAGCLSDTWQDRPVPAM